MTLGIVSYGLYLPPDFESAADVAAKAGMTMEEVRALGIERKCRPSAEDQPVAMAFKAAEQAFGRYPAVSASQVDVVIWTGEEYKDYIAQTASIRLQQELGCRNAWAFDLVGQGVTLIQGLRVANDLMAGDRTVNTLLLAGGTRNVDLVDYRNRDTRFLLASSASGGALLLKRNHPQNRLLATAFAVDPEMADEVYVPGGGTEHPFSPDNLGSELMFYQVAHPDRMTAYLNGRWAAELVQITRTVTDGRSPAYLALRHLALADRQRVVNELGLKPNQCLSLNE